MDFSALVGAKQREVVKEASAQRIHAWFGFLPWIGVGISCLPLILYGYPEGHDWQTELVRVSEYQSALLAGQFPPVWSENLYAGYGSPVFLFYAPLFSLGASLASWAVGSIPTGSSLLLIVLTVVSLLTARSMLRASLDDASANSGSVGRVEGAAVRVGLYGFVLHPYLIADKLTRNANAEFAALCLIPLVVLGVLTAATRPRAAFAALAGGLALSILSHNLTALIALGTALIAGGMLYLAPLRAAALRVAGLAIATGLGMSAFFWLPANWFMELVRTDQLLGGKFDFHIQFKPFVSHLLYGHLSGVGLLTPAIFLAALYALYRVDIDPRKKRLLVGAIAGMLGFAFMLTSASTPIWESVPLLPYFQFPWRMLGPLALVTAIAATLGFALLLRGKSAERVFTVELVLFVLFVANAWPALSRSKHFDPEAWTRIEKFVAPESIRVGRQKVTVGHEFLPRGANPKAWVRDRPVLGPVISTRPQASLRVETDHGSHTVFHVQATEPTSIVVARWFYPGWQLTLDDTPAQPRAAPSGAIEIRVPRGRTRVDLQYRAPLPHRVAQVISFGFLVFFILVLWRREWILGRIASL
ncbi:MAG: hypothetical protein GY725_21150 [bacterium]|nr:hypothetical protein [bacterium]